MKNFNEFLNESVIEDAFKNYKLTSYYDEIDKLDKLFDNLMDNHEGRNPDYAKYANVKTRRSKNLGELLQKIYKHLHLNNGTEENAVGISFDDGEKVSDDVVNLIYPDLYNGYGIINPKYIINKDLHSTGFVYSYSAVLIKYNDRVMVQCYGHVDEDEDNNNVLYATPSLFFQDLANSGYLSNVFAYNDNKQTLADCMEVDVDRIGDVYPELRGVIKLADFNL